MHHFFKHFDFTSSADNIKPIIGLVKLLPLPGSIRFKSVDRLDEIMARAEQEATALASGGVHGLLVENTLDQSFSAQPGSNQPMAEFSQSLDPAATVMVGHIVRRLRQVTGLPVGIQILPNDPVTALGIAAVSQASMIRVPLAVGAKVAPDGFMNGQLTRLLAYQKALAFSDMPLILMDLSTHHILPGDALKESYALPAQLKPLTHAETAGPVGHLYRLARYIESQCSPEVLKQSVFVVSDAEIAINDIARLRELLEVPIMVWSQKLLAGAGEDPDLAEADVSAYSAASGLILDAGIRKRVKNNLLPTVDMVKVETLVHKLQSTKSIGELEASDPDFFVGHHPGHPSNL
ncbi:MAG: BtpA/SgcQ family protein [Vampirovibrionales bacterium]|nr:BtpA/SgcQ family protein [Vampirovibrionales bacterium]